MTLLRQSGSKRARFFQRHPGTRSIPGVKSEWLGRLLEKLKVRVAPGKIGALGERLAARHLENKGYRVLARNYSVKGGEADILAAHEGLIVVIEVKTRRSVRFGTPAQAVTARKRRRVLLAGQIYCRRNGHSLSRLRGDVVSVMFRPGNGDPEIRHYVGVLGFER